jgi:hypothetical protein
MRVDRCEDESHKIRVTARIKLCGGSQIEGEPIHTPLEGSNVGGTVNTASQKTITVVVSLIFS